MDKIRDSADILQPEKEETYQFIEKLLSSVKESFSTNRVHLGMDEAVMLGLGNYLKENGYKNGYVMWPIRTALSGKQMTQGRRYLQKIRIKAYDME